MGFRARGPFRCRRCGKPRPHTCVTSAAGRRRRGGTRLQSPLEWVCPHCRRPRGLRHSCGNAGDFRKRRRQAAAAERRRKRKAATARRAACRKQAAAERRARERKRKEQAKQRPARPRPRSGESHEPGSCGNRDCPKYGCVAYWRGLDSCPGPHTGE